MSADGGVRALVVYESMFGCTKRVAGAVADGLRQEGVEVQLAEVGQGAPAGGTGFDLLVVGAPTHAFSLSRPESRAEAVQRGAPPGVATTGLREWLGATPPPPPGLRGGREAPPRTPWGEPGLAAAFDTRVPQVRRFPKAASTGAARLLR